jgi:23S rRNA (cytosine1962-C5)-methyltransferase
MLLETYDQPWDFQLLDSGSGFRLEKWAETILVRPDPQAIWEKTLPESEWQRAHAKFEPKTKGEGGQWKIFTPLPEPWILEFQDIRFLLKLSPFKHTGIFAEQSAQWNWMVDRLKIKNLRLEKDPGGKTLNHKSKILNLFAYTGGATMVLAKNDHFVTHVDASKPSLNWAAENQKLNHLPADSIRWMLEDVAKFAAREAKRGNLYDGIVMDPPAFGHGPTGKTWIFERDMPGLLQDSVKLLSPQARFLVVNAYATNSSALALKNLLEDATKNRPGQVDFGELCLKQASGRLLSTGIFARWSASE